MLLIVELWGEWYLWMWVYFLGSVVLFRKCLHNYTQDVVGEVTLSQPAAWKDPQKNNPTIRTQLHLKNQHKMHKRHPRNITFRWWRRLHHKTAQPNKWIWQNSQIESQYSKIKGIFYTGNETSKTDMKNISFDIATRKIKYLGINQPRR